MRVACVQWHLSAADYLSGDRFERRLDPVMRRAVGPGPDRRRREPVLVAFPEDIGAPCLLVGEGPPVLRANDLQEAVEALARRHALPVWLRRLRQRVSWPRAILLARGGIARSTYERVFGRVARRYQAYIVAGSVLVPEGGQVYNVAYLFGPDGEVLLRQRKAHLIDLEGPEGLDLSAGEADGVEVVDTPFGKLGLAVCLDAFEEDVMTRLDALGCEVLVQPSANPQPWSLEQREDWLRGASTAVRRPDGPNLVLNPMMVGNLYDLTFEGQSAVFAREGVQAAAILSGVRAGTCGYMGMDPDPRCIAVAPPNREYVIAARMQG